MMILLLDIDDAYRAYMDAFISWLPKLIIAILFLIIGLFIIRRLQHYIEKLIKRFDIDIEVQEFLVSLIKLLLKLSVFLLAASILGIELTAILGLLAAASFAVGLALQGFLGNFASGLTIIFFKPYKVGDWVEIDDKYGQVLSIQIFNTLLLTPENKKLVIPNGAITDGIVINYSDEGFIRLEITLLLAYETDFSWVKEIVHTALRSSQYIISGQDIIVGLEAYDTHNIVLAARPCIDPSQYWLALHDCNERIKTALSENNIPMAYSEGIELGKIGR